MAPFPVRTAVSEADPHRGTRGPEVRRLLGRRRRERQAGRAAHRRDQEGRRRRRGHRLRDGRHHRRPHRPRRAGQPRTPRARELDMLLTAGERISMAVLAMAIHDLGVEARSYTGSQAGLITDSVHGKARIIDVTPGPHPGRARRRRDPDRRRLPGRRAGHQGHHHARPRRLGHHRRRARRGARRRRLRDLHRRRRHLHRRPAHRAHAPARSRASPTRRCSSSRPTARRCCTCAAWSTRAASTSRSTCARRSPTRPARSWSPTRPHPKGKHVEQPIIAGVAHDLGDAKVTVVGVPDTPGQGRRDLPRRRRRRASTST